MWKAELKEKKTENNYSQAVYLVEYSDGTDSFQRKYVFDFSVNHVDRLKGQVKKVLKELNEPQTLSMGEIDLTEPVDSETKIARREWFSLYQRLQSAQELLNLGIITGTEKKYTDLLALVKSGFKASYIDNI